MIECQECGTKYMPATDAYKCPTCGAENYPPADDDEFDHYPDDIGGEG